MSSMTLTPIHNQYTYATPSNCLLTMQDEIVDETDCYVDNEQHIRVDAAALARAIPVAVAQQLSLQDALVAEGVAEA